MYAMKVTYTTVTHVGTGTRARATGRVSDGPDDGGVARLPRSLRSRWNHTRSTAVEITIASADRQPKCDSTKSRSHSHARATISTGGAAKCVKVPPIDTL